MLLLNKVRIKFRMTKDINRYAYKIINYLFKLKNPKDS